MKLLRKKIDSHTCGGSVEVEAECVEDMWQIYNLLVPGDRVRATALRKVVRENAAGGPASSERVRVRMNIQVTSATFDQETGEIRCSGRNTEQHELVKLGAYQTLDLEQHRNVDITKDLWDSRSLDVLKGLTQASAGADLAVVLLEPGCAEILYVTASLTLPRARVDVSVPKKRAGCDRHATGLTRFFDATVAAMARVLDFSAIKVVIIASAGFLKDDLYWHMLSVCSSKGDPAYKRLQENKDKIVLAHAPSGQRRDLVSVLSDPALSARLSDTKISSEVKVLSRFFEALAVDPEKAHYGWKHVRVAVDRGAVQTLLLSDSTFRSRAPGVRQAYTSLADDARAGGASVHVFSTQHPSGEQLGSMGGVAALLRYPLPEMDMEEALRALGTAVPGGAGPGLDGDAGRRARRGGAVTGSGGGAEGEEEVREERALEEDSDGSSDSDASYKRPGGPLRPGPL